MESFVSNPGHLSARSSFLSSKQAAYRKNPLGGAVTWKSRRRSLTVFSRKLYTASVAGKRVVTYQRFVFSTEPTKHDVAFCLTFLELGQLFSRIAVKSRCDLQEQASKESQQLFLR